MQIASYFRHGIWKLRSDWPWSGNQANIISGQPLRNGKKLWNMEAAVSSFVFFILFSSQPELSFISLSVFLILKCIDNLFDHCPIFCTVDVQSIEFDKSSKLNAEYKPKPSWKRASEEEKGNYKRRLEDQLSSLHVPESLYCMNVKCQDTNHCNDIDDFITNILEFVQSSVTDSIIITTKCSWMDGQD